MFPHDISRSQLVGHRGYVDSSGVVRAENVDVSVPASVSQQSRNMLEVSPRMSGHEVQRPESAPPMAAHFGDWESGGPSPRLRPMPSGCPTVNLSPITPASQQGREFAETRPDVMQALAGTYEFGLEDYDLLDWLSRERMVD